MFFQLLLQLLLTMDGSAQQPKGYMPLLGQGFEETKQVRLHYTDLPFQQLDTDNHHILEATEP